MNGPEGLAILGSNLLVTNSYNRMPAVGEYGIPAIAIPGNAPTSSNASFLSAGFPDFIAVVPEPSTWALLGIGAMGAGLVTLRRRRVKL